jgi:hypothetical protein
MRALPIRPFSTYLICSQSTWTSFSTTCRCLQIEKEGLRSFLIESLAKGSETTDQPQLPPCFSNVSPAHREQSRFRWIGDLVESVGQNKERVFSRCEISCSGLSWCESMTCDCCTNLLDLADYRHAFNARHRASGLAIGKKPFHNSWRDSV